MTVQIELTPEQEAELRAIAARESKTLAQLLIDRALSQGGQGTGSERARESESKKQAWAQFDRERETLATPSHLWSAKIDAEFLYAE